MNRQMRNVTMLEDLPDLNQLEQIEPPHGNISHGAGLPPGTEQRFNKFVRQPYRMMPEAGMGGYAQNTPMEMVMSEDPPQPPPQPPPQSLYNCLDVSKHVQDCPICSRFYASDRTVYIIAIIVLSIVCLLLLKKVLNV